MPHDISYIMHYVISQHRPRTLLKTFCNANADCVGMMQEFTALIRNVIAAI